MDRRIPTYVFATDPISEAGIAAQLRARPAILVVADDQFEAAEVAVVVTDVIDDDVATSIRGIQRNGIPKVVVVSGDLDSTGLLQAVEAGACGFLRRADARPEQLEGAVRSAAKGDGSVPPDLLGRLLEQVGALQRQVLNPRGLNFTGLNDREVQVLRLVADGYDTAQIAGELCYSERTVKNVIHDITSRLNLRNRSHAVAYALREGLI